MKLMIISASQRSPSQSAKVGQYLQHAAQQFTQVEHIELCRYHLPFWDGEAQTKSQAGSAWPLLSKKIQQADGYVLITPEWGGMASPLLKNLLLMCDQQDTGHKPALLVSVVNGISGAYPIAELRMNALKNNKIVATPDHLILRNIEEILNQVQAQSVREQTLRDRIDYNLYILHQYCHALTPIRQAHQDRPYPKQQEYCYGM